MSDCLIKCNCQSATVTQSDRACAFFNIMLDQHILLLDGGMGHLIKQWGAAIPDLPYEQQFLAGCLANVTDPDTVLKAHTAYIDSGCDVITANNFVATLYNLNKVQKGAELVQYCQV